MTTTIEYYTKDLPKITKAEIEYIKNIISGVEKIHILVDGRTFIVKSWNKTGWTCIDVFTKGKSITWMTSIDSKILNA